ncbi:NACHT domain-containing protein [Roseofilum capinflatum]|uniref:NACHT domain-containing protein n=1 Tax=Roseofilum capinflatum BLCC-M114 TaxID=3022440 RepID=A0ABT7B2K8_9CYAN|nr:NACHT domain-containing protein [Roseofilum capinflatum]MDJ1173062.1 NACHT domain-containing protein [Roseofilum capinflatum BLCC-M114]
MPTEQNPSPAFSRASQVWLLEELYRDLGTAKQAYDSKQPPTLEDQEKEFLRGLLCGHDAKEIGQVLHLSEKHVRTELSRKIYRYVEQLTGRKVKHWSEVPLFLEQYRRGGITWPTYSALRSIDLIQAPNIDRFLGRKAELDTLKFWFTSEQTQLLLLWGKYGVGKSLLVAKLAVTLAEEKETPFQVVVWRSLLNFPRLSDLIASLKPLLAPDVEPKEQWLTVDLLRWLHNYPCLLILDDWQAVCGAKLGEQPSHDYSHLLQSLSQQTHRSCIVLISEQQPAEYAQLLNDEAVRELRLKGLCESDALELLDRLNIQGTPTERQTLIQRYQGNPRALSMAAMTLKNQWHDNLEPFLESTSLFIGDAVAQAVQAQLNHLQPEVRSLLDWLTIAENQSVTLEELTQAISGGVEQSKVSNSLSQLQRLDWVMIAPETHPPGFQLDPMIAKYMRQQLSDRFINGIWQVCQTQQLEPNSVLQTHLLVWPESNNEQKLLKVVKTRLNQGFDSPLAWQKIWQETHNQAIANFLVGYTRRNWLLLGEVIP